MAVQRMMLTLLLWVYFPSVLAQSVQGTMRMLTTADGLPNARVTGLIQDKAGFIWISTADGLGRYDGRSVKIFRNRPGDSLSLVDNKITQLEETASGQFIVGTASGNFQLFNPVTEQFTNLLDERFLSAQKATITQCHLSADGRHVWGLMPGVRLIHYDRSLKTMAIHDMASLVGETNVMAGIVLTASGYVYGICSKGLFQLNTRTGRKRIIPCPFQMRSSGFSSGGHDVVEGPDGQIVIFGYLIVVLYDPARDRFRTVPVPNPVTADMVFYSLKTLSDNRLYVNYMDRLYRLEANNQLALIPNPGSSIQIHSNANALLLDRSGVLWSKVESGGLTRLDLHPLPFTFRPKQKSFTEDLLEKDLGLRLPDSLLIWNTAWWPRYTTAPNKDAYLIDPARVFRYQPARQKIDELKPLHFTDGRACCKLSIKVASTGRIWYYSNDIGLIEADADGNHSRLYPNSRLPLRGPYPGHDAADIQPVGNSVWVASHLGLGLFQYDIAKQRYVRQFRNDPKNNNSLPYNTLNCLIPDPTDPTKLWIGTAGGGLCQFNIQTATFRRFGEAEGFPNGNIQSMETDKQGFLWCGTSRGLIRLNPKAGVWRHFTTNDGLANHEFSLTSSASLPDGRLVFGTPSGRIIFDPLAIHADTYEPPIVLTSLKINNTLVESNAAKSVLPAPINALSELVLDHTQNFLTFEFAGLQYTKPENMHYRYRLSDVDPDWVDAGTQNTANYTQLQPGHYTFEVMTTNSDGRWSQHTKQLAVVIRPPFWATWWAYALYALIFGGAIVGFVQFRIRQGRQRQEMELRRRESEQLKAVDELKTRFFSNITHEFRTPLSLILSPTEKLLRETKHDEPTRQTLTSVQRNAGQLLNLINQLLDLSKLEAGSMAVSLARGNVAQFIAQVVESFRPMADQKGIILTFRTDTLAEDYLFDADKWLTITTNLLANALKFTPTEGQVTIHLTTDHQNTIRLIITDTGIGISAEKLPHIFDRFYQVDDTRTRAYEGTGIGLSLVKELIDVLGGTISVESQPDKGTTFTVLLPVQPALTGADVPMVVLPTHIRNELSYVHDKPKPTQPVSSPDLPMVLVIDDNAELRSFIADELTPSYRILTATNGQEGWALAQAELPDIVISDIMMPGMDGYELTHHLKTSSLTNHIAVMLLTARASHESRMDGLTQGADDYLIKPFHLDELHQRLRNLLTRQQILRDYYYQQFTQPDADDSADRFQPDVMEDEFLRQLHTAIDTHLDDSTFGVEELARIVGMSRRTLNRKLAAVANQSANDIIRQYRLKRAAQFLRAGRNVSETAYLVGYESPAHFSLIFKEFFQKTPTEFTQQ